MLPASGRHYPPSARQQFARILAGLAVHEQHCGYFC